MNGEDARATPRLVQATPMLIGVWHADERVNLAGHLFSDSGPGGSHGEGFWRDFYSLAQGAGATLQTLDRIEDFATVDTFLFIDCPDQSHPLVQRAFATGKPRYLVTESPVCLKPENWRPDVHEWFLRIFTWNDQLVDHEKFIKMPLARRFNQPLNQLKKAGFCTVVDAAADCQDDARLKAIRWFEQHHPEQFHLYGHGWDAARFPSYRGPGAPQRETLARYRFALCYERSTREPGYLTAALFDCFEAQCIPVYLGAPNIDEYVPPGCYVDRRSFGSDEELYTFLSSLSEADHRGFLERIAGFLNTVSPHQHGQGHQYYYRVASEQVAWLLLGTLMRDHVVRSGTAPLVSIVIPSYNCGAYIEQAVSSALEQNIDQLEVLVLDNASSDETERLVQPFLSDTRVRYIKHPSNIGVFSNWERGMHMARGIYAMVLSADDYLLPGHVRRLVDAMEAHPECVLGYTPCVWVDQDNHVLRILHHPGHPANSYTGGRNELASLLGYDCYITPSSAVMRRSAFDAVGGFDPHLWGGGDWDLYARMAMKYGQFVFSKSPSVCYRIHPTQQTQSLNASLQPLRDHLSILERVLWSDEVELVVPALSSIRGLLHTRIRSVPCEIPHAIQRRIEQVEERFVELDSTSESGHERSTMNGDGQCKEQKTQVCSTEGDSKVQPQHEPEPTCPMVSVIVPTHDRPEMLREAVESILAQTFRDFEIIVINDGGVDVESILSSLNHEGKIMYVRHGKNRDRAAARNSGLKLARGKYIAYLDDDDRYYPDHLQTLMTVLAQHQEYRVAYSDAWRVHYVKEGDRYVIKGKDLPYSHDFDANTLLVSNYFPVLTVMHERACLDQCGVFDETLSTHEDWDLWIKMSRLFPFLHVKRATAEFSWRTDGSSTTSGNQPDFIRTAEIIHRRYRVYAEAVPGTTELQAKRLAIWKAALTAPSYVCSIIIPVWNKLELTVQCLKALAEVTTGLHYEVIIVDNASTDGTAEFLATLSGDVQIVTNPENLGFAKACNQGARIAKGKYLVFLNNDTIPQKGWLQALVSEVEEDIKVGIVGSRLLYADGTVQHAGVVRDLEQGLPYHIYKGFAGDHRAVTSRREFQVVTAACMLVRRTIFEAVEGFDEGYINGFEDADLCLKVRERGYAVVYQPRSVVVHLESQTPGRKAHEQANVAHFLKKWGGQWWAADEDRHFYIDGYNLKRVFRNGQTGGDIVLGEKTIDRAMWAHVAAAQTAALNKDWHAVRRELALADEWPNDPYVLSWGARVAERLEEPVSRIRFLTRSVDYTNNPSERLALVRTLLEHNEVVRAEEQLGMIFATSPNHADGLLLKGILSMQREQYGSAEDAFASALREGADRKRCLMGMGMAAMGRAYAQGAWERFVEVLVDHPNDPEAIHWLLRAGTAQNRWEELADHLCSYVTKNPRDLAIRFALASVLLRGDQIEAARREYDALRTDAPAYDGLDQLGQMIAGREAPLTMGAASC